MKYHLYILSSVIHNRKYIGITADLTSRLAKHNGGSVRSTKAYRPWHLVYNNVFPNKTEARKRETELKKNNKKREVLFKMIDESNTTPSSSLV